ncbi:MAG TPA: efflux RND transporter periplasmic adaptor subunit [Vicinamibacterales bacterium]|jgi:cobalt-zinc-cadmium efflux system membrane fusion protein|nr:efflux RND transporter periplasmic adaptor subunit [Vicinamibacterales bacterium]
MRRVVLAIGTATTLWACGGGAAPPPASNAAGSKAAAAAPVTTPPAVKSTTDAGYFTVPSEQLPQLKIAPVRKTTWSAVVRTTGTVDWDNDHTTQAITQVSGPITRIVADTGTRVKVGDPLLYVASADITNAIATYRKAKNRFDLAQHSLDRSKDLFAHKALAQRDLESAEADYNDAATDLQTALQTLKIFGVRQTEITEAEQQNVGIKPELVMRAPLPGTVVQKMVLPGQFIQAGTTAAFVISNTATVWVQGHVYDKDLRLVHVGDKVDERNSSFPQTFQGVISYVGDMLDPATRTTPVRIVTQNPDGLLKKDLFVDITIHDKTTQDVLVVPTAAVLYNEQNFPFVYVQVETGKFAQRLVKIGGQQGDDTQIVDGLQEGTPVVSQGSVFLQFANSYQ